MNQNYEKRNIYISIILSFVFVIISILSNFFFTKFLIQTVGVNQYGIKSFVNSITSWLSLLSMGMSSSFVRFSTLAKKEGEEKIAKINSLYLVYFIFIAFVAIIVGLVLVSLFVFGVIPLELYSPAEKNIIYITMSLSILYVALGFPLSVFTLIETVNSRFIVIKLSQITIALFSPLLCIPFLLAGFDVWIVAAINLFFQICSLIFDFCFCKFVLKAKFNFKFTKKDFAIFKQILFFCLFVFINIIIDHLNSSLDTTVLGFASGPLFVSFYQVGYTFYTYANFLSTSISNVFVTKINRYVASGNDEEVNKTFLHISSLQLFILGLSVSGFLVCGTSFLEIWVGSELNQGGYNGTTVAFVVAIVLLFSNFFHYSQSAAIEIQRAKNQHKFRTLVYSITVILNLALTIGSVYVFDGSFVIYGCLFATAICNLIATCLLNIHYKKTLKLDIGIYFKNTLITFLIIFFVSVLVYRFSENLMFDSILTDFIIKAVIVVAIYTILYLCVFPNTFSIIFKKRKL